MRNALQVVIAGRERRSLKRLQSFRAVENILRTLRVKEIGQTVQNDAHSTLTVGADAT